MIKKVKQYRNAIFWIALWVYYSSFAVFIYYDSGHYLNYVKILEGSKSFLEWDIVRGPVFPFIIYLNNLIFGSTHIGLLFLTFASYALMIILLRKILNALSINIKNPTGKIVFKSLVLLFVILNPIIFGYYHSLLTEFVAMTIALFMCYLSWKWLDVDYYQNKKMYLIFTFIFIFGTVFTWHLKQPYVAITIFPLLISTVISILQKLNFKNLVQRCLTVFLCFLTLFGSIKAWNYCLEINGLNLHTDRNVVEGFGTQILKANKNFNFIINKDDQLSKLITDIFLNDEEKNLLLNKISENDNSYFFIELLNHNNDVVDRKIIDLKNNKVSLTYSVQNVVSIFTEYPLEVIDGYLTGYFVLSDIYKPKNEDGLFDKEFTTTYWGENGVMGTVYLNNRLNTFPMTEQLHANVINYEVYNDGPFIFKAILNFTKTPAQLFYSFSMCFLPFLAVVLIVLRIRKNKSNDEYSIKEMNFLIILTLFSLMNALVYVGTGACIDRYAAVSLIPMILTYGILIKNIIVKYSTSEK